MPNYDSLVAQATKSLSGGGQVFAGQRDDPFYIDLGRTFDLVNLGGIGTGNEGGGRDTIAGFSDALDRAQAARAAARPATRKAVCGCRTTRRATSACTPPPSGRSCRSRTIATAAARAGTCRSTGCGNPLINELIIGLPDKDKFNRTSPKDDVKNFAGYVVEPEIVKALNALFDLGIKEDDRTDLVDPDHGPRGAQPDRPEGRAGGHPQAQHGRSRPPSRARRAVSESSAATPPVTRTGAGSVTTSSTSRCGWPAASCCPRATVARSCRWATASIATTSRSSSSFPYAAGPTPGNLSDLQRQEDRHDPTPADPAGQP